MLNHSSSWKFVVVIILSALIFFDGIFYSHQMQHTAKTFNNTDGTAPEPTTSSQKHRLKQFREWYDPQKTSMGTISKFEERKRRWVDIIKESLPRPPPKVGIKWALSGFLGVPVVVVDLGDGERWLRVLHLCQRATLLLWRAPEFPSEGSAPQWLEQKGAYVLAALSSARIYAFLDVDTAGYPTDKYYQNITEEETRHLQLDSKSPILMASGYPLLEDFHKFQFPEKKYIHRTTLLALWRKHNSFRGLMLQETEPKKWTGFFMNPFQSFTIPQSITRPYIFEEYPKTAALAAAQVARISFHNLGGSVMTIQPPTSKSQIREQYFVNSVLKLELIGNKWRMMDQLESKFNIRWRNATDFFRIRVERIARYIATDDIEFSPEEFMLEEWIPTALDVLPASCSSKSYVIAVPRTITLSAWRTLLRACGNGVWAALLGVAVSMTLVAKRVMAKGSAKLRINTPGDQSLWSCAPTKQRRLLAASRCGCLVGMQLAGCILLALFQVRLFSLMVIPENQSVINTLMQLTDSHLPLFTLEDEDLHYSKTMIKLQAKGVSMQKIEVMLSERIPFAWLQSEITWDRQVQSIRLSERMRIMKQAEVFFTFLHVKRNWPWVETFNRMILRFQEAGLQSFWEKDYNRRSGIFHRMGLEEFSNNVPIFEYESNKTAIRSITLTDVLLHIVFLILGIVSGIFIFVVEIFWKRYS